MPSYDAIVIGGGTNGMAAAMRLGKAGRKVLLLEAKAHVGGGAETSEFAPGYRVSRVAHLLNVFDSRVARGLAFKAIPVSSTALSADGNHLAVGGGAFLKDYAGLLKPFKQMAPPDGFAPLAKFGFKLRNLGRDRMREFLRLMLINVADHLEDELTDDRLKGLLAHDAVQGAFLGPRSPNSLMLLLNRLAGDPPTIPLGGMGAVADAMKASLKVDVRTSSEVVNFVVEKDAVSGVTLKSGEELRAPVVLSAINPKTTFLKLLGVRHLDTDTLRSINAIRMRGAVAKLHLALSGAPDFKGADLRSRLVIAPSVRAVEDAFNPVKYGEFSQKPVMEIVIPSAFEDGLAPHGHHVLSAIVQYAPYALNGGWKKGKSAFLKAIMAQLEAYAPGIGKLVVAQELLTPEDIERDYGFIGGNWHHGELAVERMLFLRPFAEVARYATPIKGLFLAGAGSHPGGGISGAAGWNAAERALA